VVLSAACVTLCLTSRHSHGSRIPKILRIGYAALLIYLLAAVTALPARVTALTGKGRAVQNAAVCQTVEEAVDLGLLSRAPLRFALTRNRAGSLRLTLLAFSMFSAAVLSAGLGARAKTEYLRFLAVFGALVAVAGYLSLTRLPQKDTLWWVYPIPHALPGPVACFSGRNNFGAFLALISGTTLGLIAADLSCRRWLLAGVSALALICTTLGAVFSLSRAALLACAAAILGAFFLLLLRRRVVLAVIILLIAGLSVTALFFLPTAPLLERVGTLRDIKSTDSYVTRVAAWRDSVHIWRSYPILGAGPNAFRMVYPQHRTTSQSAFMTHAENELVQLFTDSGLVGFLIAVALCLPVTLGILSAVVRGGAGSITAVAAGTAMIAAAATACFDFALHTPLYGTVVASVVGLAITSRDPSADAPPPVSRRWLTVGALSTATLLLATLLSLAFGTRLRLDSHARLKHAQLPELRDALVWAPTSWQAWYYFGRAACAGGTPASFRLGERCFSQAGAYDANNYRLWRRIGKLRLSLGDRQGARDAFARVRSLRWWAPVPSVPDD